MPTTTPEITPAVLTPEQAATYLSINEHTLAQWRSNRQQRIPFVKIGGRVRYRKADLDAWIQSRVVEA
ncbi:helix-turn-helix domain-containing protein [Paraburkholderia acidiphila]|uniref:Helix-turn-helix domain-containing protein n=1 Tax=Paraburkholderia acidiphila TaxID=2571747 RepID=A0A7Z2J8S0_9BURK|nr:helix-turn-helix domain-containing protein [Paraburkholderia acidiphila]QGZ54305.1 helix-turn-helix domain-containing protein [Paraburkholderia acidiphila]